jgi:catechol 2,3-dioxygenase-like lactoylglutathione lyase family enzyme
MLLRVNGTASSYDASRAVDDRGLRPAPGGYENGAVDARLDVITLAVADLERALAFYRRLGLESNGIVGTEWTDDATGANGAIAMFRPEGGLLLNLYPRADLAKDAAIPVGAPQSGEFSLAHLVRSRDEVDELLEKAAAAGATVTPAHDRPWGIYSGYFHDPDGHLWEVIWHPERAPQTMDPGRT